MDATAHNDKFEGILDLEFAAQAASAAVECQLAGVPLYLKEQKHQARKLAKQRLYEAIDRLTPEELAAYGPYRARVRQEAADRRGSGARA